MGIVDRIKEIEVRREGGREGGTVERTNASFSPTI
jgi:hypothetical protein